MDLAAVRARADHLIRTLAGTTNPTRVTIQQLLTTTPDSGPYQSAAQKLYEDPGTEVLAALKLRPVGSEMSVSDMNMWSMGEARNIDLIVYVSQLEAVAKSVTFDERATDFRVVWKTVAYDVLKVEPRSHMENIPTYYRLKCARSP